MEEINIKKKLTNDDETYLQQHSSFLGKLSTSVRAVNEYRKLFNTLCPVCQNKVVLNPRMPVDEYCPACKNKVIYRIERVKKFVGMEK